MGNHHGCRIKSVLQLSFVCRRAPHPYKYIRGFTLEQGWSLSDCTLHGHKVANDERDEIGRHFHGKLEIVAGKRGADWHLSKCYKNILKEGRCRVLQQRFRRVRGDGDFRPHLHDLLDGLPAGFSLHPGDTVEQVLEGAVHTRNN